MDLQCLSYRAPVIVGGMFRVEKKLGEGSFGSWPLTGQADVVTFDHLGI